MLVAQYHANGGNRIFPFSFGCLNIWNRKSIKVFSNTSQNVHETGLTSAIRLPRAPRKSFQQKKSRRKCASMTGHENWMWNCKAHNLFHLPSQNPDDFRGIQDCIPGKNRTLDLDGHKKSFSIGRGEGILGLVTNCPKMTGATKKQPPTFHCTSCLLG